jgi:membrane-associated phospholipid phosphatase
MPEGARKALIGAGALTLMLFATWYAAFHIAVFQHADVSILRGFAGLAHHPHVGGLANRIATLCDPNPYVYFCAVPVLVAIARRRPWVALAVVAILLGANVTTQLLKPLLAHPRTTDVLAGLTAPSAKSWPSGHATAAMSLALASVLAAPRRWRPFVAAMGAAFAVAVSYSFLTLGWHYPSDVFGGFLVAGIWALLAVAAVFTANARRPQVATSELVQRLSIREALGPPSAALLGAVVLSAVVVIARPEAVASYARAHGEFVLGASAIAALGLALVTGLMLALRK